MTQELPVDMHKSNVHPADKLFELREQIRSLQAKADAIRNYLIENQDDLVGDETEVKITTPTRKVLSKAKLEAKLGDLSEYMEEVSSVFVRAVPRKG